MNPLPASKSFREWYPNAGEKHVFDVGAIVHGVDGSLRISLRDVSDSAPNVLIFMAPLAVRVVCEGSLMPYWEEGVIVSEHSIFMGIETEFLEWLERSSGGVHPAQSTLHFAIFSDDICIEVLSAAYPSLVLDLPKHRKEKVSLRSKGELSG
jgi:hypothetical protein